MSEVVELFLYSDKVCKDDLMKLFRNLTQTNMPFLGFLDFSYLHSSLPSKIIVQRTKNTLRYFMHDREKVYRLEHLLFPFKLGGKSIIERKQGTIFPFPKLYAFSSENLLNFMIKEDVQEFSFNVRRIFGKYFGIASAINSKGKRSLVFLFKPETFFEVDLEKHSSIYVEVMEPAPKGIYMDSERPIFQNSNALIGVDSYDPIQHTLIVGESGSGKTKALFMLIKAIEEKYKDKVRILVLDPHGEFLKLLPDKKIIDFKKNYIEPLDVGMEKTPIMTQLVAQLISECIGEENKYAERILFYATFLLSSLDKLDLKNINSLLTDPAVRMEFCAASNAPEARRFFDQEYQDIYIHHFNDAVLPILNFIGEYELYLGDQLQNEKLLDLIEKNHVTVVSFNPNFFGKRMIKFLAGAIINQMYILAITGKLKRPTLLVVDEFPRIETPIIRDLLAETRKFNLYSYLSMQYLGQLKKEVLDSIVSNVRNIISFKTNRHDATLVSSIMEIKLEEYFKKNRSTTELEESKKELFVRLHQQECVVRLFDGKKYLLPMKVKSVDYNSWKTPERALPIPLLENPFLANNWK